MPYQITNQKETTKIAMSAPTYSMELRVVEAKGTCAACHSLGDTFLIPGTTERFTCDSLCIHALYSMLPKIIVLRGAQNRPLGGA